MCREYMYFHFLLYITSVIGHCEYINYTDFILCTPRVIWNILCDIYSFFLQLFVFARHCGDKSTETQRHFLLCGAYEWM